MSGFLSRSVVAPGSRVSGVASASGRSSFHGLRVGSSTGRHSRTQSRRCARVGSVEVVAQMKALIFDCDGVIVESEDLHRRAYNAAFEHFNVRINGENGTVNWSEEFYEDFQNKVGGGKPKMRWYFGHNGWPTSSIQTDAPATDDDREALVDALQEWKSQKYRDLIGSGSVSPRPGVLRLLNEAKSKGLKVAVCSAATKESVIFTLKNLLGEEEFGSLDCFLAGDDVPEKKPSPLIYKIAAEKLAVDPSDCVVVEDSAIGLEAAVGAGMRCIITYTGSTKSQEFEGAECVVANLDAQPEITIDKLAG